MNFEAGLPQFNSVSDEKRNHCVLTTTLTGFSSFKEHSESRFSEYVADDEEFMLFFRPAFYANGDCKDNEGHVSIIFYGGEMLSFIVYFSYIEFSCTVAVIDVAGNKRFMQTLAYVHDPNSPSGLENGVPKFGLDRYLRRETLINDSGELIPGDCLTICVEVDYLIRVYSLDFNQCIIQDTFVKDGDRHYFSLDSAFGRELCKVCDYFQRASDTPMMENKTRRVYIPPEELKAFHHINLLFTGAKEIKIESIADICQLYTVADKYDIQTVIETCRQLVKSFLRRINDQKIVEHAVETTPMVLELAEAYSDGSLKEIVKVYLENKKNFGGNQHAFEEHVKDKLNTDWDCEFEEIERSSYFKLRRIESEEPEMEFYKR